MRRHAAKLLPALILAVAAAAPAGAQLPALTLPTDLPAVWATPSVEGLPVAPVLEPLPVAPAKARYGLPGSDHLRAGSAGAELHGPEGSERLSGGGGARRSMGEGRGGEKGSNSGCPV